jgi:protein-disulfide isomerase
MSNRLMFLVIMVTLFFALDVLAQTPTCDKLTGEKKELAQSLLNSEHPYDCCDDTISNCLKKKPTCDLAIRLAENICRRVMKKQDKATISRGLAKRARTVMSMMSSKKVKIDLSNASIAGDPAAPVELVTYSCARCPYCSKMVTKLYDTITEGQLKGKVKLYFRVFPIRSHEYSKETGLGFLAANKLGKFWEFVNYSYEHFDVFCIVKQEEWAEAVGMDKAAFKQIVADPVTRQLLVDSKKEGIVNKVDATPTFFIEGVKYLGDNNHDELVDVLEEIFHRKTGH